MKILVITNLYPPHGIGGYEIRCRDVCERLRGSGHDVHILTSDHHVAGREVAGESQVSRKLQIHGMYGHAWLPIHRLWALEKHNHKVLADEIAAVQPDLIHVWNMGGISKSLLLRVEQAGVAVVYDVSDHWIARSLRADVWLSWWNRPRSGVSRFAHALLRLSGFRAWVDRSAPTWSWQRLAMKQMYFCSAFMRDFTVSMGWSVGHAAVIHCGIDTAAFAVKTDHSQMKRLLWVGRLAADKDPLTAVRALAVARRAGLSELTLDLYGHGEPAYVAELDAEIARLELAEYVTRRQVTTAEMRQLVANYDALLFTSNWGEPFALTPLEAMASGLPVITSLDGGQRELARDKVNCLVATAADPESFAVGIAELESSLELRQQIAATALAEVRERFDIAVITRQIESFLTKSLDS